MEGREEKSPPVASGEISSSLIPCHPLTISVSNLRIASSVSTGSGEAPSGVATLGRLDTKNWFRDGKT